MAFKIVTSKMNPTKKIIKERELKIAEILGNKVIVTRNTHGSELTRLYNFMKKNKLHF
jgi:hypothetical protein